MKIIPKESYSVLGTGLSLKKGRVYDAERAFNQSDYLKRGLVFVGNILLRADEYDLAPITGFDK